MNSPFSYALPDILDFTPDDLRANQRGRLTARQQVVLRRRGSMHNDRDRSNPFAYLLKAISKCGTIQADIREGRALAAKGVALVDRVGAGGGFFSHIGVGRDATILGYMLYIDGQKFFIDRVMFYAIQPKARYALYYAPHSKVILAAERLE